MPFVGDEQQVKRDSAYLRYESGDAGNELILKSNLYRIPFHFLQQQRKSVACHGKECFYCGKGYQINNEYNYWVYLNGQTGVMNIKPSVFFDIQKITKAQKKDPRQVSWTVVASGQGKDTRYSTSKNDNLSTEDYERAQAELEENNEKLKKLMLSHEQSLENNYAEFMATMTGTTVSAVNVAERVAPTKPAETAKEEENSEEEPESEIEPDDIPF